MANASGKSTSLLDSIRTGACNLSMKNAKSKRNGQP